MIDVNAHRIQLYELLAKSVAAMREHGAKGFMIGWLNEDGSVGFSFNGKRMSWVEQVGLAELLKHKMVEPVE